MPNMKRVGMPSPGEIVHGYLNSDFHSKNFKQPFTLKIRFEIAGDKISKRWHSSSFHFWHLHFWHIKSEEKKSTLTFLSLEAIFQARVLQSVKISCLK